MPAKGRIQSFHRRRAKTKNDFHEHKNKKMGKSDQSYSSQTPMLSALDNAGRDFVLRKTLTKAAYYLNAEDNSRDQSYILVKSQLEVLQKKQKKSYQQNTEYIQQVYKLLRKKWGGGAKRD